MLKIIDNYEDIKRRIADAEAEFNREPGSVQLIGVTKKQPMGKLKTAAEEGMKAFGENHLQEALAKLSRLKQFGIEWHFLGAVQSNKTEAIAKYFNWVQSIDRAKIALRLSEQRPEGMDPINILLQVNVDDEDTKAGVAFEEIPMIANFIKDLPNVKLRGLMCIPAIRRDFDEQREPFRKLREAFEELKANGFPDLDTLSMGMSHDFEAAIAEGSNMVRIGAAIFGSPGI